MRNFFRKRRLESPIQGALNECIKQAPRFQEFTISSLIQKASTDLLQNKLRLPGVLLVLRLPELLENKLLELGFVSSAAGKLFQLTDIGRKCKECGGIHSMRN